MDKPVNATSCSICLEDMVGRTPRALACLHTFCHACLEDLYKAHTTCPNYFSQEAFQTRAGIECPVCRKRTAIPKDGIKGLPVNFMINQLREMQSPGSPRCDIADRVCHNCHEGKPVVYCEVCDSQLCDSCQTQHNKVPAFKGHQVQKLKKPSDICAEHNKEAKFICGKCCVQICMKCALAPDHRGHSEKIQEFDDWFDDAKTKIADSREKVAPHWLKLKQSHNVALEYKKNLEQNIKAVNEAADSAVAQIKTEKDNMIAQLRGNMEHASNIATYLHTLYTDADSFMQMSIGSQSADPNNVMRLMSLSNLASSVLDDVNNCPSVEQMNKVKLVKNASVSFGSLKKAV